jgi:uncharacterized Zn finger protein
VSPSLCAESPMTRDDVRENAEQKGRRYAVEGRLLVRHVTEDRIEASCHGNGEVYSLGLTPSGRWWCSCPAVGRCCHLVALQLVCVAPRRRA